MIFAKPMRRVSRVFLHCSASDRPEHDDVSVMREWHRQRGWKNVGYHFFIRKDGTVQPGRPIEEVPSAQEGNNTGTVAICLHGLKAEAFTAEQFEALRSLAREIDGAYSGAITFHGHCEVSSKACPVFDYRAVLGLDSAGTLGVTGMRQPAEAAEADSGPSASSRPSLQLMSRGEAVIALQERLGITADGHFGRITHEAVVAFQAAHGFTADGIVGNTTWAALDSETKPKRGKAAKDDG